MIKKLGLGLVVALAILALTVNAEAKKVTLLVPDQYATIQAAVDAAMDGDTIRVGPGTYAGALVNNSVEIKGEAGETIINDGPDYRLGGTSPTYWLRTAFRIDDNSADGAVISHMIIDCSVNNPGTRSMFFAVFARGADDVTVSHLIINGPVQAITNYHGNGWVISHNKINDIEAFGGGGIGILMGSGDGRPTTKNVVAHNTILSESLGVTPPNYSCPGLYLVSDRRWGRLGGKVTDNKLVHNTVDVGRYAYACGWEIDDFTAFYYPSQGYDVTDNKIGFNDVRGCPYTAIYYPDSDWGDPLDVKSVNIISRNLTDEGQGRGHGVTPASIFNENDLQ